MTTQRPDLDPALLEPSARDPRTVAREQFIHGLLESLRSETAADTERRIDRLMSAIEAPVPIYSHPSAARRADAHRQHVRRWPVLSSMAAAILLVALVMLGSPGERTALATVQQSLAASQTAGDRHYDISVSPPDSDTLRQIATLDVRDPSHYLVAATSPQGDTVTLGKNGDESWAIHPDGTLERYPERRILPPWINFGTSTVMLVAVDDLLATLEKSYDLRRSAAAPVPGTQGPACERITAIHKGGTPQPNTVDLWIDPSTHVVRRMELHWTNPPRVRLGPGPREQDGDPQSERRPQPREGNQRRPGPGRDLLEEARFAADNGLPFPPPERNGPGPNRRPGAPRPEGPRDGRDMGGPPDDEGPDGDRPPPPDGDDMDRPPPPEDDQSPRPPGPPNRPRGPRPQFLDGPPDFARHPPPPRTLVFQLAEGGSFREGWFDPSTHGAK